MPWQATNFARPESNCASKTSSNMIGQIIQDSQQKPFSRNI